MCKIFKSGFRLAITTAIAFLVSALLQTTAVGDVILMNNAGTNTLGGSGYEGHSFTMPSGSRFNNITFSWISSDQVTLLAAGNLFLLSEEYLMSPNGLSDMTSGYIAESIGIEDDAYVFDESVILEADTQYWVYMGGESSLAGGGFTFDDPFPGGQAYEQFGSADGDYFNNGSTLDFNFVLSGDVVNPIPEPGCATTMLALGSLILVRRRRL